MAVNNHVCSEPSVTEQDATETLSPMTSVMTPARMTFDPTVRLETQLLGCVRNTGVDGGDRLPIYLMIIDPSWLFTLNF